MKLEGFWEGFGWEEVLYQCCRREKNKEKIHKEQNLLLPSLIIQILVHYRRYCIPYIYNIHIFTIFLPPNSHKYFCKQKLTSLQFFINAQCSIWMLDPLFPFSFEDPELLRGYHLQPICYARESFIPHSHFLFLKVHCHFLYSSSSPTHAPSPLNL